MTLSIVFRVEQHQRTKKQDKKERNHAIEIKKKKNKIHSQKQNPSKIYLPCRDDCTEKSDVELHFFCKLACADVGRGDGDGAGETELLLGESECKDPFE